MAKKSSDKAPYDSATGVFVPRFQRGKWESGVLAKCQGLYRHKSRSVDLTPGGFGAGPTNYNFQPGDWLLLIGRDQLGVQWAYSLRHQTTMCIYPKALVHFAIIRDSEIDD